MYKSYSYSNMPVKKHSEPPQRPTDFSGEHKPPAHHGDTKPPVPKGDTKIKKNGGILAGLEMDDLILIAVVLILISDGCDDKLLLLAIAYVFLSDS